QDSGPPGPGLVTNTKNGPRTNSSKLAWPQVSKLILSLVSQCKHRAGISMAELKQTLAAEGYDVSKNNRQVSMVTKRMVGNGTLVRTTRNTSFRLSKVKHTGSFDLVICKCSYITCKFVYFFVTKILLTVIQH
uniref:H15 domain-containing protein n=1 Tax=Kryptolebias marmoratus TaxID=37003 RepID=A0A3Q2ZZK8_KRYMA